MRKFVLYSLFIFLYSCSSPQIKFSEYKEMIIMSDDSRNLVLNDLDAKDSIYSLIYFTSVFKEDLIKVENGDKTIFNDTIKSDESLGLAEVIRINNTLDVKITDMSLNYSFNLKKKSNMNYKYIYIERKRYEDNKYVVIYSNSMRAFY
ncbi:hypothetical protein [Flavobacterium litorale]|uniref:Lipoprotein n=1 Tax=Flavobacterium litorale TaxID=2856519 RepID=A0ABX8V7M3_9FLAO|nr:hypothetical protein [Flavobacterium litorale]QYJ68821.1 hypothetical protein K1I41_02765 [Flavobacterium litorale]